MTEDYSEYESVDEEEPEEEAPKPKKAAKTKTAIAPAERKSLKASDSIKVKSAPEKLKRNGSSGGAKAGQGSLANFFNKK